jgi:hypothetical protein
MYISGIINRLKSERLSAASSSFTVQRNVPVVTLSMFEKKIPILDQWSLNLTLASPTLCLHHL